MWRKLRFYQGCLIGRILRNPFRKRRKSFLLFRMRSLSWLREIFHRVAMCEYLPSKILARAASSRISNLLSSGGRPGPRRFFPATSRQIATISGPSSRMSGPDSRAVMALRYFGSSAATASKIFGSIRSCFADSTIAWRASGRACLSRSCGGLLRGVRARVSLCVFPGKRRLLLGPVPRPALFISMLALKYSR